MPNNGVNVFESSFESNPYPFKVEGKSRLTPFEALYLLELWCDIVEREGDFYFGAKYRMNVCDTLREIEYRNPDWHFDDFENWIKDRFSKFTRKDWREYYKDVKKGKYV